MGFIIEYYLICESQNNKTQVPCCLLPFGWGSRGTGFIMKYAFVCGGSAGELCPVLAMVHCMRSAHFLLLRQPLQQTETEALEQFEIIIRPAYRAPVSCVLLVQQF